MQTPSAGKHTPALACLQETLEAVGLAEASTPHVTTYLGNTMLETLCFPQVMHAYHEMELIWVTCCCSVVREALAAAQMSEEY